MKQNLLKYGVMIVLAMIASTELLWADCHVEIVRDTFVKVDTVRQIDTIAVHDTCLVVETTLCKPNKRSVGYDFLFSLFVSILGAFMALVLTYLLLRPQFEISPIGVQTLNNRVMFVVKNKSLCAKLYNIKAELDYVRYNDQRNDIELIPIDLDSDNSISILSANNNEANSLYVFHTKEAFVRDERYNQVRLRVSATNTISNIFDAKDRMFYYSAINTLDSRIDDIRWGTLDRDIFVPIEIIYNEQQKNRAKRIILFNEYVMRIFVPRRDKETFIKEQAIWDAAEEQLKSLKPGAELYKSYTRLRDILPTINSINADFVKLKNIYTKNSTLTHRSVDKRDELVKKMKRDIVLITRYMQASLT